MNETLLRKTGRSPVRSGAIAGAVSVLVFTIIHDILISDIWFSLLPMAVAGALCGLCVGWSYALLTDSPSIGNWLRYNLLYVIILALLGVASVLAFEPSTSMAALIAANRPPEALIGKAMPLTALFTLVAALLMTLLYGWAWMRFSAILLTCATIILLLGLNVSTIGLVSIPRGSLYLVGEMFGLILVLNLVYAGAFVVLERKHLLRHGSLPVPRTESGTNTI